MNLSEHFNMVEPFFKRKEKVFWNPWNASEKLGQPGYLEITL